MAKQTIKHGSQSLLIIIVMLGIIFFVNVLSARFFIRADLTENKKYTLTDASKEILSGIDDIVNIHLYFSDKLPPYLANLENEVKDMLDEYRAYAGSDIRIEFIDPASDPELKQKVRRMGIPELQLRVFEKDQRQIRNAFLGISIQYGDKNEVIPVVQSLDNLEYDLTSAILKVTETKEYIIGWIGTRERDESATGFSEVQKLLDEGYLVRSFEPDKLTTIPQNIDTLIVPGNQSLPERALFAIDQYMMANKEIIFLSDAVELSGESLSASPVRQNIHDLLEYYGIGIEPSLILDKSNAYAAFNSGFMRFSLPYPFWPKILEQNFNKEKPEVNQLESLVLPWVSPIQYIGDEDDDITVSSLMKSSKVSWLTSEPFNMDPQQKFDISPDDLVQSMAGVVVEGKFRSFFEEKPIPEKPQQATDKHPDEKPDEPILESDLTSFVVISSTRFINNQFIQQFRENVIFFQNIVDSLTIGDKLIGIRSREVTIRELDYGTRDEQKITSIRATHRVLGTFGVPVIAIVFGFSRFWFNKKRKQQMIVNSGTRNQQGR